jgi:hypothetical protein
MTLSTRQKIKNEILTAKCDKRTLACLILFYYNLHISPYKKTGSTISVSEISKSFNIKIGEETTMNINKLLFYSQVNYVGYMKIIAETSANYHINKYKKCQ